MGAHAPNEDTQKRRLIDGLWDPKAQKYISLRRPADLAAAKQEARNWEEVQLSQQRRRELLHGPAGVTTTYTIPKLDPTTGTVKPQSQVVVNAGQVPYLPPNPYMSAPTYML